jgi:hypothetical protein
LTERQAWLAVSRVFDRISTDSQAFLAGGMCRQISALLRAAQHRQGRLCLRCRMQRTATPRGGGYRYAVTAAGAKKRGKFCAAQVVRIDRERAKRKAGR